MSGTIKLAGLVLAVGFLVAAGLYAAAVAMGAAQGAFVGRSAEPTAWDRMTDLCEDRGGVRHSYVRDIHLPAAQGRVKCSDGVNLQWSGG